MLRHHHVSGVEFAVADNLDVRDVGNLLADQFEDRAAEVPGDALVGLRALEPIGQEAAVEPLAARGEAVDLSHARCLCMPSWCQIPLGLREHDALVHLGQRHRAVDAAQVQVGVEAFEGSNSHRVCSCGAGAPVGMRW